MSMSSDMDRIWAEFQEPYGVRAQYYGGEIVMQANPTAVHDHIVRSLVRQVDEPYEAWGERGIDLGQDGAPRPDAVVVRSEDVDLDVRDWAVSLLQVVVEVVSPGKRAWRDDWETKRELYAGHSIGWYLIVDPRTATWHLMVLEPSAGLYVQHGQGVFGQEVRVPLGEGDLVLATTAWHPYPA
jgi:Uma2 family endonuclease